MILGHEVGTRSSTPLFRLPLAVYCLGTGIAPGEKCHNGAWIPLLFAAVPYGAEFGIGGAGPPAFRSPPWMPIELKQSFCGASVSKACEGIALRLG
jgi:hypothetical protein